jgi:hypothetical protein
VFTGRTSIGLDVHARSVAAAAIDGVTGELAQRRFGLPSDRYNVTTELGRIGLGIMTSFQRRLIFTGQPGAVHLLRREPARRLRTDLGFGQR